MIDMRRDKDVNIHNEIKDSSSEYLQEAIEQFQRHGFTVSYFEKGMDAAEYLCDQIQGKTVGFGDSATLTFRHRDTVTGTVSEDLLQIKQEPNCIDSRGLHKMIYTT